MATPKLIVDRRTAEDIARQVRALLKLYVQLDPATEKPTGLNAALIGVFARYAEIVIQRLNQAPEKNYLAFLDMLGAARMPPQPARVPLTFALAPGSPARAVVPAGTQVAAPPAAGEREPIVFETERELSVTAVRLESIATHDPAHDWFADRSTLLAPGVGSGEPVFEADQQADQQIEHLLYLELDRLFRYPALSELRLTFTIGKPANGQTDPQKVEWEIWDGADPTELTPGEDSTNSLTTSGDVVFADFAPPPGSQRLVCRLLTPITTLDTEQSGMARAGQIPAIEAVSAQMRVNRQALLVESAFANAVAVTAGDFLPFGEKPKFGDALYLAQGEAFSTAGAHVTLQIDVKDLTDDQRKNVDVEIKWEFGDGKTWIPLGTGGASGDSSNPATGFADTTRALTKSGTVEFDVPQSPQLTPVQGVESYWVRARIIGGGYGHEASYEPVDPNDLSKGYRLVAATLVPPLIESITVAYRLDAITITPRRTFAHRYAGRTAIDQNANSFVPSWTVGQVQPALYFGFNPPPSATAFPNQVITMYLRIADVVRGGAMAREISGPAPRLVWEYWNNAAWAELSIRDTTETFERSGLVEFIAPADFGSSLMFGMEHYWVRARWASGTFAHPPRLCWVLLNTTLAAQLVAIRNEILGSSDGSAGQTYHTTRKPVLLGRQLDSTQLLEVREPEKPPASEQAAIVADAGETAISVTHDASRRPKEIWVRWHEAPDFYASGPRDRHYVLDHLSGEVRFGDGLNGLIPPVGTNNIRLALYQTGGGKAGNRPAGAIVQLKTTVPYVASVTNTEAAMGGADEESVESLLERAPRAIRHSGRAVTIQDYADLARLASPEVARARCVPLYDLAIDPDATKQKPGTVSMIIVPRSDERRPLPNLELISRVRDYLDTRRLPDLDLVVVGPDYVRVDVQADIALKTLEGASEVERAVRAVLDRYLHPLTGGLDGRGWEFGRQPYTSDLYALIESVSDVDHVRALAASPIEDRPGALATGRFLVYSGTHRITLIFEEP